jgi:serine/threonine protein kinase
VGEALGSRYVLEDSLGHGGMGSVYRATSREGGRDLAVKVLQPGLAGDPGVVARFVQERSIMLGVSGEHVVQIHDMVVEGDKLAIVMDYLPGGSLRGYLDDHGPLDPVRTMDIVRQVLSGLVPVHDVGIVHRDIKPANLLVDNTSDELLIKVADFGISRVMDSPHLTAVSSSIGTPSYMAPELVESEQDSPAADIYAVGVLAYEMLNGRTPFAGPGGPMAMWWRHANVVAERPDGIDDDVWTLLSEFLEKDPSDRPADARAALGRMVALGLCSVDALAGVGPPPAPVPQVRSPRANSSDEATRMTSRPGLPARPIPPVAPSQTPTPGASKRRQSLSKTWLVAFAGVLVLLLGGAAAFVVTRSSGPGAPVVLPFAAETYEKAGFNVSRTWVLSGHDGNKVHGELIVQRTAGGKATFEEVLPKEMVANTSSVAFSPQPVVVNPDPIVRYTLNLPAGGQATVEYDVPVSGSGLALARLETWAADQAREAAAYRSSVHSEAPVTLVSMQISPKLTRLQAGDLPHQLKVTGRMTNGSVAPKSVVSKAVWSSSDTKILSVTANGTVTPLSQGTVTVTSSLGRVKAVDKISVLPSAAAGASGAPTTGDSTSNRAPGAGSSGSAKPTPTRSTSSGGGHHVACPADTHAVGADCVDEKCPTGTTGAAGDCVSGKCPSGAVGTPPNCTTPTCPDGTVGTPPDCVTPPTCPDGTVGTPPDCVTPPTCPDGTVGTPPDCTTPTCPDGTVGTPPDCTTPTCSDGTVGTPPDCVTPDPSCTPSATDDCSGTTSGGTSGVSTSDTGPGPTTDSPSVAGGTTSSGLAVEQPSTSSAQPESAALILQRR